MKKKRKLVLVIEDEDGVLKTYADFLNKYEEIEYNTAVNAKEALDLFEDYKESVNGIILDLMLPYGDATKLQEEEPDQDEIDTGFRILKEIRKEKKQIYVAVVTSRANPEAFKEINKLLGNRGKLYSKPVDSFELEHDFVTALGIESQVPEIFRPV